MGWKALAFACVGLLGCTGDITGPGGGAGGADAMGPITGLDGAPDDRADAAPDARPEPTPLASNVRIREVALYQGIKVVLAENGAPVTQRVGPVVEGAAGMMGIFVEPETGFQSRTLRAVVTIDGTEYTEDQTIAGATGDNPQDGGFTVDIPQGAITTSSTFSVELREIGGTSGGGATDGARYPASATADFAAESAGGPLRLVLVPYRYDSDGSGRLPPMDATAVAEYERLFRSMYPVAEVDVTVREPVSFTGSLSQSGWSSWLDRLVELRSQDGAADNVYYYGVMAPASSFSSYCRGGCILGLGYVPGATNSYLFGSVGVSFADSLGVFTALHEVGHTTGRNHAPCGGVSGADPGFPHSGGGVGVWGYDVSRDQLKDPDVYTDVMGYCRDQWISDYTYGAIFDRLQRVNQAAVRIPDPRTYRVGLVDGSGAITWTRTQRLDQPLRGDERTIAMLDGAGNSVDTVTGHFFPYDHLPGGVLMVPLPAGAAPAAIEVDGLGTLGW